MKFIYNSLNLAYYKCSENDRENSLNAAVATKKKYNFLNPFKE